jgi:hypothetical protein
LKVLPDDLEFKEGDQMWSSNKRTKREIRNLLQKTDPKKLKKILKNFFVFLLIFSSNKRCCCDNV